MNEKEDFLSRWSRRKQEAARDTKPLLDDEATPAARHLQAVVEQSRSAKTGGAPTSEPVFDISKLPSLESIGPGTDIRAFLQPGVPLSLSRAALRRVWSADPAIRDFVGLSENSWDFTKPESIAGFGDLLPIDDVKQLLSRILANDSEAVVALEQPQRTALQHEHASTEVVSGSPQLPVSEQELVTANRDVEAGEPIVPQRTQNDLALQQEAPADERATVIKPRHGGALPT